MVCEDTDQGEVMICEVTDQGEGIRIQAADYYLYLMKSNAQSIFL